MVACKTWENMKMAEGVGLATASLPPVFAALRLELRSHPTASPQLPPPSAGQWRKEWDWLQLRFRLSSLRSGSNCVLIPRLPHSCPRLRRGNGGRSGIRTHGRLPYTRFRVERLRPDSAILPRCVGTVSSHQVPTLPAKSFVSSIQKSTVKEWHWLARISHDISTTTSSSAKASADKCCAPCWLRYAWISLGQCVFTQPCGKSCASLASTGLTASRYKML